MSAIAIKTFIVEGIGYDFGLIKDEPPQGCSVVIDAESAQLLLTYFLNKYEAPAHLHVNSYDGLSGFLASAQKDFGKDFITQVVITSSVQSEALRSVEKELVDFVTGVCRFDGLSLYSTADLAQMLKSTGWAPNATASSVSDALTRLNISPTLSGVGIDLKDGLGQRTYKLYSFNKEYEFLDRSLTRPAFAAHIRSVYINETQQRNKLLQLDNVALGDYTI